MTEKNQEKPRKERITELRSSLSESQRDFASAMVIEGFRFVKEGAEHVGLSDKTVYGWKEREQVYELIRLMREDLREAAEALLASSVFEAAAVKVAGLRDEDPRLRQSVATEVLDRGIGKVPNKNEISGPEGEAITIRVKVKQDDD